MMTIWRYAEKVGKETSQDIPLDFFNVVLLYWKSNRPVEECVRDFNKFAEEETPKGLLKKLDRLKNGPSLWERLTTKRERV